MSEAGGGPVAMSGNPGYVMINTPLLRRTSFFLFGTLLLFLLAAFVYAHLNEAFFRFPVMYFLLGLAAIGMCGLLLFRRSLRDGDYLTRRHERLFLTFTVMLALGVGLVLLFVVLPGVRWGFWGTVLFGYVPLVAALLYLVAAVIRFREAGENPDGYPELTAKQAARREREVRTEWAFATVALAVGGLALYQVLPEDLPETEAEEMETGVRIVRIPEFLQGDWDSLEFLTLAAEGGDAEAQYQLGRVYFDEDHPRYWRDPAKAVHYFELAAEQDHVGAMLELARLFRDGYGSFHDQERAVGYFRRAVDWGDPAAARNLGRHYLAGRGVPAEPSRAYELFRVAAEGGDVDGARLLGEAYQRGRGVERSPERAYRWLLVAAEDGDPAAQNDVGLIYLRGSGAEQDVEEGIRWLGRAAEQDFHVAIFNLGMLYYRGDYVPRDYSHSFQHLSRLASAGHVLGHFYLGSHYHEGLGVTRNAERGFEQFKLAAAQGYVPAIMNTGGLYLDGDGVERDLERGLTYMERAAMSGSEEAQWRMGLIYDEGEFVMRDPVEAMKWFLLAANRGHEEAAGMVEELEGELSDADRRTARGLAGRAGGMN